MGMRQRVAARGGRFDIRRGNPHGTDIRVVLPVPTVGVTKQMEQPGQRGASVDDARDDSVASSPDTPVERL